MPATTNTHRRFRNLAAHCFLDAAGDHSIPDRDLNGAISTLLQKFQERELNPAELKKMAHQHPRNTASLREFSYPLNDRSLQETAPMIGEMISRWHVGSEAHFSRQRNITKLSRETCFLA